MAKKKLIVFKIPQFPNLSETFVIAQIVTAIKLDFEVKIITRKFETENSYLIDNLSFKDKVIVENYKIPKNKVFRVLKWAFLLLLNILYVRYIIAYYKAQKKFSLTWLFHWSFYKQFNNAEVFHVQYGTISRPLPILKKTNFFKPKLIVTFHGHDAFFPLYGYIKNNNYYKDLFEIEAVITANTPYLSNKLEQLGCPIERIEVVPVAVDTSFFYPNYTENKDDRIIRLITVGRLDKVKGHRYCIEVIRELQKFNVKVELSIIGEGAERENLEALINKYNLTDCIKLLGSKNPKQIREALWNHDLYLLLAVPVENERRETQGLATLEAQACGLPAIVFDSGGVKYTVNDGVTGIVCKEFDVDAVVNKIKLMFENRTNLKMMSTKAVKFVNDNYSQRYIDEKWRELYENYNI